MLMKLWNAFAMLSLINSENTQYMQTMNTDKFKLSDTVWILYV